MSLVDGIGGVFLFSSNPEQLAGWYADRFGIEFMKVGETTWFKRFVGVAKDDASREIDTSFGIMKQKRPQSPRQVPAKEPEDMYGDQPFMLNLRLLDMDATVAALEAKGDTILKREDESYGRFAWVRDADGNRVELYQPIPASE